MDTHQQYRQAAAELRGSMRAFCAAMRRTHEAAQAWDPTGEQHDAEVEALVADGIAEMRILVATVPGVADLLGGALFGMEKA